MLVTAALHHDGSARKMATSRTPFGISFPSFEHQIDFCLPDWLELDDSDKSVADGPPLAIPDIPGEPRAEVHTPGHDITESTAHTLLSLRHISG